MSEAKEKDAIEHEGNYVLKNDRLYDTATYRKNRKSSKYGMRVQWDKSKTSKDILELEGDKDIHKQSENGFHFYGTNFCCWRAYPDPHRVMQEIIDWTLSSYGDLWESHLDDLAKGKGGRFGCYSIQLYMVPGANDAKYPIEFDKPIVHGTIFIGSFHVSGIKGKRR